ncbi:MAG: hypothetical protein ACLU9S_20375 [Oscillospiraceae bacterium]
MSLFKPKMDPAIKAKAERPGVLVFVSVPCVSDLPVPEKDDGSGVLLRGPP